MPIYRPQVADPMTSFVRGLNPEGIARAYNYGAYNRGMAERDQAELEMKARRQQEDNTHKAINNMADIMGNEGMPSKLRYESYENYTAMMNSLIPGTYPGRIMSEEEFFSKPGQGIIKDLAKKQKTLNDQFLKGELKDPSGNTVTDRSKAARLINIYMNQNLLDSLSGPEGQYIDQKDVDYVRGMSAVQPQKPMNIGGELYQPGTGKFMPQVPKEPTPPADYTLGSTRMSGVTNKPIATVPGNTEEMSFKKEKLAWDKEKFDQQKEMDRQNMQIRIKEIKRSAALSKDKTTRAFTSNILNVLKARQSLIDSNISEEKADEITANMMSAIPGIEGVNLDAIRGAFNKEKDRSWWDKIWGNKSALPEGLTEEAIKTYTDKGYSRDWVIQQYIAKHGKK